MDYKELETTARLAHLSMSEDELRGAFGAFEQMLEYFQAMQRADALTAARDGAPSESAASGRWRGDRPAGTAAPPREILENAGEHDGAFIIIPNVL